MVSNFDRKMVVTYWDNIFKLKKIEIRPSTSQST